MNNDFLLSLAGTAIPILAIGFVGALLIYKVYVKIRSKFNTTVNCWFCNGFSSVPYLEANCWTCPLCEQYNGFTKDGDYNREMVQQFDCSNKLASCGDAKDLAPDLDYSDQFGERSFRTEPNNGFCNGCNEAQRLKVEKLAQFEPKNESHFDAELKVYKRQMEDQYRLCDTCDRHLKRVLREKKKMVLGSKFLDFIIKGAETLKQPHFNKLRRATRQHWKRRLTLLTGCLAVLQLCCLYGALPTLTRDHLTRVLGTAAGDHCFAALSHVMALGRVCAAYWQSFGEQAAMAKVALFFRTVFIMILYSLGLKLPQIARINFASLYVAACPFALLSSAFVYCGVDRFKLTRYTVLLVLWSAFAGGLVGEQFPVAPNVLMFLASLLTLLFAATNRVKSSPRLHDSSTSFHKLCSEDYLSDDDTLSLLSQQLNCSTNSMASMRSTSGGFESMNRFVKQPLASSMHSLIQPQSPNASFASFCRDDNHVFVRPQYATHSSNFTGTPMPRSSLFASNVELNAHERPHMPVFGLPGNGIDSPNASFSTARPTFPASYPQPLHAQQHSDENLLFSGCRQFRVPIGAASPVLLSPFSVSSNTVFQPQRPSTLLSPSRFSAHGFGADAPATSWLSGGYFNHRQQIASPLAADARLRGAFPLEHRANGMTAIDENLSRASSHSSGFESQNGRLNASRENLIGPDVAENGAGHNGFQPIETQCNGEYSPRPSLLPYPAPQGLLQPLLVNCGQAPAEVVWRAPSMRRIPNGRDSFNLRKINEELPRLQRGELLKKWKSGQIVS